MTFAARFLRYPDLFPARIAGDRWGDHSYALDLPGGPYHLHGLSGEQLEALDGRYRAWRAPNATVSSPVPIDVFSADAGDFFGFEQTGPEYLVELDHRESSVRIAASTFAAIVDLGRRAAVGIWTPEPSGLSFVCAIENVLRPLVALRASMSGGLLLHSSAVLIGDRCFLFVGPSGAGKSTVAGLALARGHRVLSDDLNCLRPDAAGWRACLMPFAGDHQGKADEGEYPVAGILRLEKADRPEITPLSAADGFSLLYSATPYVNTDRYRAPHAEDTIQRLVESLPAWRLAFRKDESLWPIIEAL